MVMRFIEAKRDILSPGGFKIKIVTHIIFTKQTFISIVPRNWSFLYIFHNYECFIHKNLVLSFLSSSEIYRSHFNIFS